MYAQLPIYGNALTTSTLFTNDNGNILRHGMIGSSPNNLRVNFDLVVVVVDDVAVVVVVAVEEDHRFCLQLLRAILIFPDMFLLLLLCFIKFNNNTFPCCCCCCNNRTLLPRRRMLLVLLLLMDDDDDGHCTTVPLPLSFKRRPYRETTPEILVAVQVLLREEFLQFRVVIMEP